MAENIVAQWQHVTWYFFVIIGAVEGLSPLWSQRITRYYTDKMTSSNGNIFRVTGHLCGKFTGHRLIPRTKASDAEIWCFLWSAPVLTVWVNNSELVIWDAILPIMTSQYWLIVNWPSWAISVKPEFNKMHLNISSAKHLPFCSSLNVFWCTIQIDGSVQDCSVALSHPNN